MNPIQARLKSEPFAAVFEIASKTFKPITIAYLLYSMAIVIVLVPVIVFVLGADVESLLEIISVTDPLERSSMFEELFLDLGQGIGALQIVALTSALVSMTLMGSWFYNFCFIAIEGYIRGRKLVFAQILSKSFNINVVWLTMAAFVFILLGVILFVGLALLTPDSGGLSFLIALIGSLLINVILMRFILLFPSIVHGNMSVGAAMTYSWRVIHFVRGLKYFGISIVVLIALVVALFVMGLVQAGLMAIPIVGFILYFILSMVSGGFMSAWFTSVQSGIYFRHIQEEEYSSDMNLEDHLIP